MTSRERILRCIKGEKTDRIPISTYEIIAYNYWDQFAKEEILAYDTMGFDFRCWYHKQESYQDLLKVIEKNTDCLYMWSSEDGQGVPKFLTGCDIKQTVKTWCEGYKTFTEFTIETPKGPLTMKTRKDDNVNTIWEYEHILKDESDVEKMLSIPYEPYIPDISSFKKTEQDLGDKGVMLPNIGDPILYVAELFGFTNFCILAMDNPEMVEMLLEVFSERVMNLLKYQLDNGVNGIFRIAGPEYITPPYFSPAYFKDFVYKYDKEMIKMIKDAGSIARIHSHGNVGKLLETIRDMGADMLDPLEAPPSGDVTLSEAKRRIGDSVTLMGNIQLRDLELLNSNEIVEITKRAIDEGASGGRFILLPTSAPINEPINPRTEENYYAMIETAVNYGKY